MRISDWSSDVCSSDLCRTRSVDQQHAQVGVPTFGDAEQPRLPAGRHLLRHEAEPGRDVARPTERFTVSDSRNQRGCAKDADAGYRSEEHTSELQSLMRISYAVFCLKNKNTLTHADATTLSTQH